MTRGLRASAVEHPIPASTAAIAFRDDAGPSGLRFTYHNGETPQHQIPETIGGGVAVLDYDGDGWLDVYVVQGGVFPPGDMPSSGTAFQAVYSITVQDGQRPSRPWVSG